MTNVNTARIAELNDRFRRTGQGGRVYLTRGVISLPAPVILRVIAAVHSFSAFTIGNDPYGEHDFGSFVQDGKKIFWKIDYYQPTKEGEPDLDGHSSPDPSDPEATVRVLTVMLAEEY